MGALFFFTNERENETELKQGINEREDSRIDAKLEFTKRSKITSLYDFV